MFICCLIYFLVPGVTDLLAMDGLSSVSMIVKLGWEWGAPAVVIQNQEIDVENTRSCAKHMKSMCRTYRNAEVSYFWSSPKKAPLVFNWSLRTTRRQQHATMPRSIIHCTSESH